MCTYVFTSIAVSLRKSILEQLKNSFSKEKNIRKQKTLTTSWNQSYNLELQHQRCKKITTPRVAYCVSKTKIASSALKKML
jgi:hypothetical protein